MELRKIQNILVVLNTELWKYIENEETSLQQDIKETMNYLLDLVDDLITCQKVREDNSEEISEFQKEWIREKHEANKIPNNSVINLSVGELRGFIKEAVAEEFAKYSYISPTYIPVQPCYQPFYPTGPYCGKSITYTVDTKTTPKN